MGLNREKGRDGARGSGRELKQRGICVEGKKCPFGTRCKFGLRGICVGVHSEREIQHFIGKREGVERERNEPCAFCLAGKCKWAKRPGGCWRGLGDSEYEESSDSDGSSGEDSSGSESQASAGRSHTRSSSAANPISASSRRWVSTLVDESKVLWTAAKGGHVAVVKLLLWCHGIDANVLDLGGVCGLWQIGRVERLGAGVVRHGRSAAKPRWAAGGPLLPARHILRARLEVLAKSAEGGGAK